MSNSKMPQTSKSKPEPIMDIENLFDIGKAQMVQIGLISLPNSTEWQTQIGVKGKRLEEGGPINVIAHICEGLGFMLAELRKMIQEGKIKMTREEFVEEVNGCKRHIEKALIDYN